MELSDASMLKRVARSVESWNRGDLQHMFDHYREDAVLCSPSMTGGRKWIQGPASIKRYFEHFRELHPELKVIDLHLGSQFFVAVLSDQTGLMTLHIEPDAESQIKRIIICRSIWSTLRFCQKA